MPMTTRTGRALGLAAVVLAGTLTPLLGSPAAVADSGCVDAWDTPDGGVSASNSCLSSTIGLGIDRVGFDAPCVAVDGMFTHGHTHAETVHWSKQAANLATAVDVYQCW